MTLSHHFLAEDRGFPDRNRRRMPWEEPPPPPPRAPTIEELQAQAGGGPADWFRLPRMASSLLTSRLQVAIEKVEAEQVLVRDHPGYTDDHGSGRPARYAETQRPLRQLMQAARKELRAKVQEIAAARDAKIQAYLASLEPQTRHEEASMVMLADRWRALDPEARDAYTVAAISGKDPLLARALLTSHPLISGASPDLLEVLRGTLAGEAVDAAQREFLDASSTARLALFELNRLQGHLDGVGPNRDVLVAAGLVSKGVAQMTDAEKIAFIGKHGQRAFELLAFGADPDAVEGEDELEL